MVAGFGFQAPRYGVSQAPPQPQRPLWGPPDIAEMLMKGIPAIGDQFGKGFSAVNSQLSGERQNQLTQSAADRMATSPAAVLMGMGQPGGMYGPQQIAGGGGQNTMTGGTGFEPRSVPSFVQQHGGQPAPSADLKGILDDATQRYELPPNYLPGTAFIESKFDPNARNPKSSAGGLFQQIDSNWESYGIPGTTRFDPKASTEAAARFAAENSMRLERALGRKPTAGELYLAHQQGPGGALALLTNPDAPVQDVIGAKKAALNGGRPGMTAGQFASQWTSKLDGQQAPQAPGSVPAPAPGPQQLAAQQQQPQAPGPQQQPQLPSMPSPQDREGAAAVVQNQTATQQQTKVQQTQARQNTFMGVPTMQPGGNVNPGAAPLQGGQGQDQLAGGDRLLNPAPGAPGAPPAPPPVLPPSPVPQPLPAPAAAPASVPYRPPVPGAGRARLDPDLIRALGWAAQSGDGGRISAAQSALLAGIKSGEGNGFELKEINGQGVLFNPNTGEVAPLGGPGAAALKAPEVRDINGVSHQWVPGQGWAPLPGGQTKAPETIEQNGVRYQWDARQGAWTPAVAGTAAGQQQFQMIAPDDAHTRRQLGIPDNDKRLYQRDTRSGKLDPVNEQRAVDDKSFTQERQLAGEFETSGPVKDYRMMEQAVQGLDASFREGNPAGDMIAVIQLFKTVDPTSTVTAGEQATPSNAAGVPESMRRLYNRALGEGGSFSPELRSQIFNTAQGLFMRRQGQVRRLADETKRRAKSYGLDPSRVVEFEPYEFQRAKPTDYPDVNLPREPLPPVQVVPPGGRAAPAATAPAAPPADNWPPGLPRPTVRIVRDRDGNLVEQR